MGTALVRAHEPTSAGKAAVLLTSLLKPQSFGLVPDVKGRKQGTVPRHYGANALFIIHAIYTTQQMSTPDAATIPCCKFGCATSNGASSRGWNKHPHRLPSKIKHPHGRLVFQFLRSLWETRLRAKEFQGKLYVSLGRVGVGRLYRKLYPKKGPPSWPP